MASGMALEDGFVCHRRCFTRNPVVRVIAFHEKAGRSQGEWFWYPLVTLFLSGRVATVATLPSALFDERFLCARCQLGVLVSAGAAICLSTFLPSLG